LSTSGIQYKSIYFNLEPATALLAAWVCIWLNLLGICLQRILQLARAGRLSYGALVPALLQFYPIFYGAWAVFNYVNDRFYTMLPSQVCGCGWAVTVWAGSSSVCISGADLCKRQQGRSAPVSNKLQKLYHAPATWSK
jgi:hypothetical protein